VMDGSEQVIIDRAILLLNIPHQVAILDAIHTVPVTIRQENYEAARIKFPQEQFKYDTE
jgi:hypothetical protein